MPDELTEMQQMPQADGKDTLELQATSPAWHLMKVYNGVRDSIWQTLNSIVQSTDKFELIAFSKSLNLLMLRGDSIWQGIEEGAKQMQNSLETTNINENFKYDRTIKIEADKLKRYISFFQLVPEHFTDEYGTPDPEYEQFYNLSEVSKVEYIKKKITQIVVKVDTAWAICAGLIGLSLPLKLMQEKTLFYVMCEALQIKYRPEDYVLYKRVTHNERFKQVAFCLALFKIRMNNHVQACFSGEVGQGKSTAAFLTAEWENKFVRKILSQGNEKEKRLYEELKIEPFNVKECIIISPDDPASKSLYSPQKLRSYVVDDALFFSSTAESQSKQTLKIRRAIAKNRKLNPSVYWIYPSIWRAASILLEFFDVWCHMEDQGIADIIIPSRVVQSKEKFNQAIIEKYSRRPRTFGKAIKHHPSFIAKVHYPQIPEESEFWEAYMAKYKKYSPEDADAESRIKEDVKMSFFKKLETNLSKSMINITSEKDRQDYIYNIISKTLGQKVTNKVTVEQMSKSLTSQFVKWQEDKILTEFAKDFSSKGLKTFNFNIEETI